MLTKEEKEKYFSRYKLTGAASTQPKAESHTAGPPAIALVQVRSPEKFGQGNNTTILLNPNLSQSVKDKMRQAHNARASELPKTVLGGDWLLSQPTDPRS